MLETICLKCRQRYPLGQDHVCPRKSRAKATKASPRDDAMTASEADGVASRLSAGRTAQGAPVKAASAATATPKRVDKRKGDRHRAGYWASYQRKDRELKAKQEKPNGESTD